MKLENTIANKEKFFALYWGQKVAKKLGSINLDVAYVMYHCNVEDYYLELKFEPTKEEKEILNFELTPEDYNIFVDRMRYNGFAREYGDLQIEDLIKYNWIKLI